MVGSKSIEVSNASLKVLERLPFLNRYTIIWMFVPMIVGIELGTLILGLDDLIGSVAKVSTVIGFVHMLLYF